MALNGVTQCAFTYDSKGRMLTRTPYSAGVAQTPTNFEWDNWDCVREFAPAGTYRYYAPQGELVTFDYTPTAGATSTYCLHSDALGSVRMITDSTGSSVAHYEYDAWGNVLPSSSDISFGFNYRYVGSFGLRWDATLGMYYCRNRFYDPTLQRFISRDSIGLWGEINLYSYPLNPIVEADPMGLQPSFPGIDPAPNTPVPRETRPVIKNVDTIFDFVRSSSPARPKREPDPRVPEDRGDPGSPRTTGIYRVHLVGTCTCDAGWSPVYPSIELVDTYTWIMNPDSHGKLYLSKFPIMSGQGFTLNGLQIQVPGGKPRDVLPSDSKTLDIVGHCLCVRTVCGKEETKPGQFKIRSAWGMKMFYFDEDPWG